MPEANYLAVLVAGLASFVVGGVWYSPLLFVKPWMAELGITRESAMEAKPNMTLLYGTALITSLLAAYAMALLLVTPQHHSLAIGVRRGLAAGIFWVATAFGSSYAFEGKSLRHWAINAGFYVVQFAVMGAILGVMNN